MGYDYVVCGMCIVYSHTVRHEKPRAVELVAWDYNVTPVPCCKATFLVLPVSAPIFAEVTRI